MFHSTVSTKLYFCAAFSRSDVSYGDIAKLILGISWTVPNQTSTAIEKEYLLTGVLPAFRNDSSVTVYIPGMTRDPIPDPYDVPTGFVAGDIGSDTED